MDPIFDSRLAIARKRRALAAFRPGADFLLRHVVEDLADRLSAVERHFSRAAAINCLTRDTADLIRLTGKADEIVRIEADPTMLSGWPGLTMDGDRIPLEPESIDLAVSVLSLHEANDLPGQLIQIRRALRPDGLFLAAITGGGTLAELRECLLAAETELVGGATPRVSPFVDVRDAGALLQRAGFALPVTDLEPIVVRYATMFHLMADLRAMGAANALVSRSRLPAPQRLFERAADLYARRFADPDGRIRATFNIVWMSGWAPHVSQQKPLKPGSGKVSLADVLKPD